MEVEKKRRNRIKGTKIGFSGPVKQLEIPIPSGDVKNTRKVKL